MPVKSESNLDDFSLRSLYAWIDCIPLSRKKKDLTRDFSDGVLVAEIIKHYFPSMVELHNYPSVNSLSQKLINWETLSKRVLTKLSYSVPHCVLKQITESSPDVVQTFLLGLMQKIEMQLQKKGRNENLFSLVPKGLDLSMIKPKSDSSGAVNCSLKQSSILYSIDTVAHSQTDLNLTRNHVPLSSLNLMPLDSDARAALEERERAWDFLQEAVKNLEAKVRKLEQLLHLKDLKLQDLHHRLAIWKSSSTINSAPQFYSFSDYN